MATIYKIVAFYSCRQRGWSETYYCDAEKLLPAPGQGQPNNFTNFQAVSNLFKTTVLTKRMPLAGKEVSVFAVRVSSVANPGAAFLDYKDLPLAQQQVSSDNPPSDLVCTMYTPNFDRKRQLHMRGIWDSIDEQGGLLVTDAVWNGLFQGFVAALGVPGWGWVGRSVSHTADLLQYTQVVGTDQVHFKFKANLFTAPFVGKFVSVAFSGINGGSELNGTITCKVDALDECTSAGRISVFPYAFGGRGRWNEKALLEIAAVVPTKIGSRDTGSPLLQPRGRARKRVKG